MCRAAALVRLLAGLAAVLLAAPEPALRPNNCTELTEAEASARGSRPALRVRGSERELWLAWRGAADRASAALLLRALAEHPRCRAPARCILRLCHVPRGLCDLLRQARGPDVAGVDAAIAAGFEPSSRLGCVTARPFGPIGDPPAPFAVVREHVALAASAELWQDDSGSSRALLVAERVTLELYAPWLARALRAYAPPPHALRYLLEREAELGARAPGLAPGAAALSAAADWAARQPTAFATMRDALAGSQTPERYRALIYLCRDGEPDPDLKGLINETGVELESATVPRRVAMQLEVDRIDCREDAPNATLRDRLAAELAEAGAHRLIGAVVAGAGLGDAARLAAREGLVLVAYDVQPESAGVPSAAPSAGGAGAALRALLAACGWRRVALLSERSPAARAVRAALGAAAGELREAPLDEDDAALERRLRALALKDNARVFVLNAGGAGAARALAAAARLRLTPARGYAWVAREWDAPASPPLALLALGSAGAAPLVRALQTLVLGFTKLFELHEELRYDHRAAETLGLFLESVGKLPSVNVTFEVRREDEPRAETLPAGVCPADLRVGDAASRCRLPLGDAFAPAFCLDALVVLGVPAALLAAVLGARGAASCRRRAARRARARLRRLRDEAAAALLERQPGTCAALRPLLVPRERVALGRALGAGRHGRVFLARLAPRTDRLAAKAPHAGCAPAEEGELLREAATLAALRHAHVLRPVGVCVGPGPPLLLTPAARHGDLLSYLRARRPGAARAAEAPHVSAAALTRLAREAALALAYLASRGVVHCDVRAANCLVDERRALKLADFGMARSLSARAAPAAPGEYYACRRRALFPVLWMAPESLARGAFSPASDVWALGVLALELATLGARPFGALGAAQAVALVARGGHARLPAGAAPRTRELALACWRREARARPTARDVARWLAAHPTALQAAPQPEAPDDVSAFGEPPPLDAADDAASSSRDSSDS